MAQMPREHDLWARRDRARAERQAGALQEVHARLPSAAALLRASGCDEAWLIGSFASGSPRPDSDVDLLVRGLAPARRADLWWELGRLFGREVDLVEMERVEPARLRLAGARRDVEQFLDALPV